MASTSAVQSATHRRLVEREAEQVRGLVEGGMGALGDDHLRRGDAAFGAATFAGGLDGAQDRLGAAAGEEPRGGVAAVEQVGGPADDLGLDGAERRERLGVERVLVQVHRRCGLGDLRGRRAAVVDEPEGAPVGPPHVVGALGRELGDDVVDGAAVLVQRHRPDRRRRGSPRHGHVVGARARSMWHRSSASGPQRRGDRHLAVRPVLSPRGRRARSRRRRGGCAGGTSASSRRRWRRSDRPGSRSALRVPAAASSDGRTMGSRRDSMHGLKKYATEMR